jgi:hypothetical protein
MSPEPTSVNFPTSLDSSVTLGGDMRNLIQLTLDAGINASTGTISVSEDITGVNVPCPLLIDSEIIWVTEKSGGDFINSVRGAENTTPATHSNGADAYLVYSANLFNQLKRAIISIENYLAAPPTEKTVSAGVLTVSQSRHKIQPESGTADDINTISDIPDNTFITLYPSDSGTDTLTFKHGTGNISCFGGSDIKLSEGFCIGYYDGTTVYLTGGGAGSEIIYDTNTNEFLRLQSIRQTRFSATINGAPSGATLVYNAPSAGSENELAQYDGTTAQTANNLCGIVLLNSTRGTDAVISNVNLGTNTITLTANVPAGWQSGDTITTDTGLGSNYRTAEIKDTTVIPSNATHLILFVQVVDTAGSVSAWMQENVTFAAAKTWVVGGTAAANISLTSSVIIKLTSRRIAYQVRSPAGDTSTLVVRLVGYRTE